MKVKIVSLKHSPNCDHKYLIGTIMYENRKIIFKNQDLSGGFHDIDRRDYTEMLELADISPCEEE